MTEETRVERGPAAFGESLDAFLRRLQDERAMRLKAGQWGPWRWSRDLNALVLTRGSRWYEVDLESATPTVLLNRIIHTSRKPWITREDVGYLAAALDDICAGESK